ncbi:MAG: BMC domain-containing protein [Deltaproteobacteria bacterium]|nr:BMC domain-containing protein [Deltaproteobacteria bacterium]
MSWRSFDEPPPPALGLIELSSIARGMHATDAMLKVAEVELVLSRTICSGKYMVLVAGEQHEVEASVAAGLEIAAETAVDHVLIPNVHPDVYPAISATGSLSQEEAIGILESFSVASLVEAIDRVAKEAQVELVQCRLAMALGGKAYLVFTGDVDAVGYSMEAGAAVVEARGLLVNKVIIPDPRPELFQTFI